MKYMIYVHVTIVTFSITPQNIDDKIAYSKLQTYYLHIFIFSVIWLFMQLIY